MSDGLVQSAVGHFSVEERLKEKMGQQSSAPAPQAAQRRGSKALRQTFRDELRTNKCGLTGRGWLRPEILDAAITADSVLECTTLGNALLCGPSDAETIVQNAKKVFAVLLMSRCQSIAKSLLLVEGLTDEDLPLQRIEPNSDVVVSSKGNKIFYAFLELGEEDGDVDEFLEQQWWTLAHVFDEGVEEANKDNPLSIQKVGENCALPLRRRWEQDAVKGGMSTVFKCELHPDHYRFQGQKVHDSLIEVAVKEIADKATFQRETENLMRIRGFGNPHLIRHLAAFQVEPTPGYPVYYLLFPLAGGGDLHDHWKRQDATPRTPQLVRWSLQQMRGLATAIYDLHIRLNSDSERGGCRHGDLKPANILLFNEKSPRATLVIADLGIAKIHAKATDARPAHKATTTQATTRAYQAPEADGKADRYEAPRPRKYDIWSLGCILLEFAVWLLYDAAAVDGFGENRPDMWTGSRPGGFYALDGSAGGTSSVCEEVKLAIQALRDDKRCGEDTALGRLVTLIETQMLVVDADKRCDAEVLVKELEEIAAKAANCDDESGYLPRATEKPPPRPEIFMKRVVRI